MKLSIVIPMYKVEDFIEKCLESCVNQDVPHDSYEIICVNDGSPDRSKSLAEQFAINHSNVRVVSQENGGLSAARNAGLYYAQGEYVWFVDSDDWIEPNCLSIIFSYLGQNLDLLEIQYQKVYENGNIIPGDAGHLFDGVKSGRDVTLSGGVHTPAPFSILRSKFLRDNKLDFYRGIYHEDVDFKVRALLLANHVASIPFVCYNYLQRGGGSITSNFKLKNGRDLLFVLNRHYIFVQGYDDEVKRAIYSKISMWMNSLLLGIRQLEGNDYKVLFKELKESKNIFYAMRHSGNLKYRIEGGVLGINVQLGLIIHSMIRE